jgi:REP element-mobilizing transposase RayT
MARPLRLEFPGALYHVISRGNERSPIFLDDLDREDFLRSLAVTVRREGFLLHAYCLLGNHFHLLVETPAAGISRGMHRLNGRHAQRFNARHARCGHLFEGRFKAILVENQSYLLELHRYIVLNPVRAGLVERPEDWKWSSYRATSGRGPAPPWLETGWTISQFGRTVGAARRAYVEFVEAAVGVAPAPIAAPAVAPNEFFRGGKDFRREMSRLVGSRDCDEEIPVAQKTPLAVDLGRIEALVAREWDVPRSRLRRRRGGEGKVAAIYLARKLTRLPAREIGRSFGVGRGRVANVVAEVERGKRRSMHPRLTEMMAELTEDLGGKTVKNVGQKCQVET